MRSQAAAPRKAFPSRRRACKSSRRTCSSWRLARQTALTAPHLLAPHRAHLTAHRISYIPPTLTFCRRVRRTTSRGMLSRRTGPTDAPCGLGGSGIAWTPAGWSNTCCSWSRSSLRHLHAYVLTKAQSAAPHACCILPCISSCGLAPRPPSMRHPSSLLTPT